MSDLDAALRPITADEWPTFIRAMIDVFGDDPTGPYLDEVPPTAELDRSLSLWDGGRVAATAGIYSREVSVPGAVVPMAGVTWVTVSPTHRRRGVLTAIMRRQLTELHEQQREAVAGLWAAESAIYGRYGYGPASLRGELTGATQRLGLRRGVDTGAGTVEIADVGTFRPEAVALYERLRREVPGHLDRGEVWWDRLLRDDKDARPSGYTARRHLLHREPDGTVTGYAAYRVKGDWSEGSEPEGTVLLGDLTAATPAALASLWRFVTSLDLVRKLRWPMVNAGHPVRHLLEDPRALHESPVDGVWIRLVDVDRALSARRYPVPVDLVLEVRDEFCPWNAGRWRLWGHPSGASCTATDRDPDLVVDAAALGAAYLGGVSLAALQAAGRVVECSPGAVTQASTAFSWPVAPWCPEEF